MNNENVLKSIKRTLTEEKNAIENMIEKIDDSFIDAVKLMKECKGKVVITGVGKSGHIGKKIAASLSSTGTSSFFMHSTEGVHGDLGMIQEKDVVLMISNSGETGEVLSLVPSLTKIGCKSISITSKKESSLSKFTDVSINYEFEKEADPLNLAPTTSSTLTLVIGDALAIAVSEEKGFAKKDFHLYHPGGSLGKKLEGNE